MLQKFPEVQTNLELEQRLSEVQGSSLDTVDMLELLGLKKGDDNQSI